MLELMLLLLYARALLLRALHNRLALTLTHLHLLDELVLIQLSAELCNFLVRELIVVCLHFYAFIWTLHIKLSLQRIYPSRKLVNISSSCSLSSSGAVADC